MTPVERFLRNAAEKLAKRYYEGPQAPDRLLELVSAFRAENPNPSAAEWEEFSKKLAGYAYRAGWQRGYEWAERQGPDEKPWAKLPPEMVADFEDPDWRWRQAGPDLALPDEVEEIEPGELAPTRHLIPDE